MTWCMFDDKFWMHPKILEVGRDAAWLWAASIGYSNANLTDGKIPLGALPMLSMGLSIPEARALAEKLVSARLWEHDGESYKVHDFLDWNTSAEVVRARRERTSESRREAGRNGGVKSGEVRRDAAEMKQRSKDEAKHEADASPERSKDEATAKQKRSPSPSPSPKEKEEPPPPVRADARVALDMPESGDGDDPPRLGTVERLGALDIDDLLQAITEGAGGKIMLDPRADATLKNKLRRAVAEAGYGRADFLALGALLARDPRPKWLPKGRLSVAWLTSKPETLSRTMTSAGEMAPRADAHPTPPVDPTRGGTFITQDELDAKRAKFRADRAAHEARRLADLAEKRPA